jgi:hypothetical protein
MYRLDALPSFGTSRNDDIFEGTFKNGEFCSGKITHTDGSVHEGAFHCAGAPMACMCSSRRTAVSSPPRTAAYGRPHTGVLTYPNGDKLALTAGS